MEYGDQQTDHNLQLSDHSTGAIRQARKEDFRHLSHLAHTCFPHSAFWVLGRGAPDIWWERAISDAGCEIWVYQESEALLGFSVLVPDETKMKSLNAVRNLSAWRKIRTALRRPDVAYHLLRKSLRPNRYFEHPDESIECPGGRLYVELFAIAPSARGKGLASALLDHNLRRAREIQRACVAYNVDRNNIPMLNLLAKRGLPISGGGKQVTFVDPIFASPYRPAAHVKCRINRPDT